jgi:hypothetical protein
MTPKHLNATQDSSDPTGAAWPTANDRMSEPQASYLQSLCSEAGAAFDPRLTKKEALRRIEELQKMTGRGWEH